MRDGNLACLILGHFHIMIFKLQVEETIAFEAFNGLFKILLISYLSTGF